MPTVMYCLQRVLHHPGQREWLNTDDNPSTMIKLPDGLRAYASTTLHSSGPGTVAAAHHMSTFTRQNRGRNAALGIVLGGMSLAMGVGSIQWYLRGTQ